MQLYLQDSTHIRESCLPAEKPYRKIVGLAVSNTLLWAENEHCPQENRYNRYDSTTHNMLVPAQLARSALTYFGRYLTRRPKRAPSIGYGYVPYATDSLDEYNCFHFARTIAPHQMPILQGIASLYPPARPPVKQCESAITAGEAVVLGNHAEESEYPPHFPIHAGLKLAKNSFLQVLAFGGNMALTNLDVMVEQSERDAQGRQTGKVALYRATSFR